jgi:hypothetical protein
MFAALGGSADAASLLHCQSMPLSRNISCVASYNRAPGRSATFIVVLLVCLMRSAPGSSATVPVTLAPWIQLQKLTAANGARDDVFGSRLVRRHRRRY